MVIAMVLPNYFKDWIPNYTLEPCLHQVMTILKLILLTMKKKPKKLSESDKQQYVSIHKLELPKVDFDNIHFKHRALDEWLFQLFKENQFSASEDRLSNNRLKENLGIIHEIYSELREFEIFVQFKCNKKHFKFSELSTSDILKYLEEFKEVHNGSSQSYHKMYDELSRLLKSDSEFSQTLSYELIPAIQLFENYSLIITVDYLCLNRSYGPWTNNMISKNLDPPRI